VQLGLHALLERIRAVHHDAAAQCRIDFHVDHRRGGGSDAVDQVAGLGVDGIAFARAVDAALAFTGIDSVGAAGQVYLVAAATGGDDVLATGAVDHVVAASAVNVVEAAAGMDFVVAAPAEDHVGTVAA